MFSLFKKGLVIKKIFRKTVNEDFVNKKCQLLENSPFVAGELEGFDNVFFLVKLNFLIYLKSYI